MNRIEICFQQEKYLYISSALILMGHCFIFVSKVIRMTYCRVCKKETKQIPVRKIDSIFIVEEYCPSCDESIMRYEKIQCL